jgi:glycosyltransferase involved in cell wall biosynthesis
LVSAITAFLDEERFLAEAIESVFAQTYKDWELLLVDDGSTDASTAIARRYAETCPGRVRYLAHEDHGNHGPGVSRNLGLRNARGEYIAFLDGDDLWRPEKLERQVACLQTRPDVDLVYGSTLFWHYGEAEPGLGERDFVQDLGVPTASVIQPPRLLTLLLQNEDIHPANCSLLARRRLCQDIGGFEDDFGRLYEDTVFLAKALLRTPVLVTQDCLAIYRLHSESSCHVAIETGEYHPSDPNPARGAFLRWLETYLVTRQVTDAELRRALDRELAPYRNSAVSGLARGAGRLWARAEASIERARAWRRERRRRDRAE